MEKSVEDVVTWAKCSGHTSIHGYKTLVNIYINTDVNTHVFIYIVYTNIHTYMYLT
jgi:hypothetical protein